MDLELSHFPSFGPWSHFSGNGDWDVGFFQGMKWG